MLGAKFTDIFPVPEKPHCAVTDPERWSIIEGTLGTKLPADYKAFIGLYGTGIVGDFIYVYNPFSSYKIFNLLKEVEEILNIERRYQDEYPALYPDPGGLLPFASTANGDILFWQTQGEPDNWVIYARAMRSPLYEQYQMNITELFVELLSRRRKNAPIKPDSFLKENIVRKLPFVSLSANLERYFPNIKQKLIDVHGDQHPKISKATFEQILKQYGFDLETDELKSQLQIWEQEKFIELVESDDVYLRVLDQEKH